MAPRMPAPKTSPHLEEAIPHRLFWTVNPCANASGGAVRSLDRQAFRTAVFPHQTIIPATTIPTQSLRMPIRCAAILRVGKARRLASTAARPYPATASTATAGRVTARAGMSRLMMRTPAP
ncbi:hypothetical protein ASG39_04770 [Rhizobium sp. Leaf371]|nr:hypothetical protein ASG39_04770 [Rhizobium sp. Leaf371]